jgi:lysophospholipase L1-like esterase
MIRLVCVGDSFTEGMCDEARSDGHHRGWADRVAEALAVDRPPVQYANLAVRGKLLDQVVAEQVPLALAMVPTIATFHAGPNDVLRKGTDPVDLARRYDAAVARMVDGAGQVLVFTSIGRAGGTGRLAELVATRFARFNDAVRTVSDRRGATLVDLGRVPALTDRRLWHVDRLHLNPMGHARVAAAVLQHLGVEDPLLLGGEPDWWRESLPPAAPMSLRDRTVADAAWVATHLLPWIGRRLRGVSSGDGREPKDPVLRTIG